MTRQDILLLDFRTEPDLSNRLRCILENTSCRRYNSCHPTIKARSFASAENHIPQSNTGARAAITLLLPPQQDADATCKLIQQVTKIWPAPLVVVAEDHSPDEIFAILESGASDFIVPPLKDAEVVSRVWRLIEQSDPHEALKLNLKERMGLRQLIGESVEFLSEVNKIPQVARSDVRILISGETGTGKELFARAIHYLSPRTNAPFIPVNCGAIPTELVENELFGHERGAFTGATSSQQGLIYEADGGTLFLDEIDCLPPPAQVKFLRFLQEKEYRPLGSSKMRRADVRVIAATNVNVTAAVDEGRMRRDFYYRLNTVRMTLPPLRERRSDIALLAHHFLEKYSIEFKSTAEDFSVDAVEKLVNFDWPGNVRELEHVIERALALSNGKTITGDDIDLPASTSSSRAPSFREAKAAVVERFEKEFIAKLLCAHHGNITRAAQSAGKNRRTFWQLIRKHQINASQYR